MTCINYELDEDDDIEETHVVPLFGREHEPSRHCWCLPEQDDEEPCVFIHNPEQ